MLPPLDFDDAMALIVREQWGRLLASLTARLGDMQLAEDALQDAVTTALVHWKEHGLPPSPAGWLMQTARRKAIDRFRRDNRFAALQAQISYELDLANDHVNESRTFIDDKRLELIFTCCHPAIEKHARVALTLHTLGGLTTKEIARAFLVDRKTMAQRLVRAKKKIALAKIPFATPDKNILQERIMTVLSVVYLIFNEGYSAVSGNTLSRQDLTKEAIRLTRILHELMPEQSEVMGLLALILLHDARHHARLTQDHQFVPLSKQNRSRWNHSKIVESSQLLKSALRRQQLGPYQLQAAISAIHCESATWEDTDWHQILALYELLYQMQPTSVVKINQAMALSYAHTPEASLIILDDVGLSPQIQKYQPYFAARADIYIRMGDAIQAGDCLKKAIELTDNKIEQQYLKAQLVQLNSV